jgi:two-component system, OmpR family, response regulator
MNANPASFAPPGAQVASGDASRGRPKGVARILVVDDDDSIRELLGMALRHVGFEVELAGACLDARNMIERNTPDLMVLDVMLPDGDGIDFCKRLRAGGLRSSVLFLTARDTTEDKVRGLTVGGDDYLTKPFSLEELVARIRAILRRAGVEDGDARSISYADVQLDEDSHEVRRAGSLVALSPTEFKLLRFLMVNAGRVVSKAQILDHVWEYDFDGESSIVETYVSYLRKKLDPLGPPLIQTVRGIGYRLRTE